MLTAATTRTLHNGDGITVVTGKLGSAPWTTYVLHFDSNATCDPSGYGEGEEPLGTATLTTTNKGAGTFRAVLAVPTSSGRQITATATDPSGNTSEFSACAQVK